ncbi:MAG: rhomboid family intramembrane serine protease [Muribaculaceae bacterium]|nr:rhomboid family intramembrane serine protease [Muribaculaceae bacterium]
MKERWKFGGMLTRLIMINVGVFLVLSLTAVIITLSGGNAESILIQWVELPSDLHVLAMRPWTLFTYMFAHSSIWHILFNMLWLWWFGQLFLTIGTQRELVALYIYGGLGGALLYLIAYATMPYFNDVHGMMLGASASVLAIVVATAWRMPDYKVGLLFIGAVAIKWIAGVAVLLSLLNVTGENAGGNIAHIGGALVGMIYGVAMNRGVDITSPLNKLIDTIVNAVRKIGTKQSTATPRYHRSAAGSTGTTYAETSRSGLTREDQDRMNDILDKIKKSGYAALTSEERRILFDVSKRVK